MIARIGFNVKSINLGITNMKFASKLIALVCAVLALIVTQKQVKIAKMSIQKAETLAEGSKPCPDDIGNKSRSRS